MKSLLKNVSELLGSKEVRDERYTAPVTRQYYFRYER